MIHNNYQCAFCIIYMPLYLNECEWGVCKGSLVTFENVYPVD